ncbi:hypoxanthine DNA-glycosylase, putative [Psychroflexus torquis ATCC 700755]|uniref:Hypoxanthine DNA-glycosylase, putative n=1 Tax=Psychroflexus torquis (strain ATCC 700755 / CIP 106069 / ACAM 623) TaxID=313595 RepID=K4IYH9_PSYTT|nr:DNA-deoxyinosine glycosylase [Psychroflexus torquis]AFU70515.1 hypoxanthine DNA-glycosylase, putative [Psychroflexus torquis ATCC 700755]
MTLHQAIEKLLRQTGRPMTTQQIADELNKNKWYQKKDGSTIQAFQIYGRIRNYADIFDRDGSTVFLIGQPTTKTKAPTAKKPTAIKHLVKVNSTYSKASFDPISNSDTAILILGTMPGDKSLELGEYYGHPRNRFWKIISTITNNELPLTYSDKKELLLKFKIGIWDIAHKANRKGSLDSAIEDEEPNDLDDFIARHKNLKVIGFNGTKSETLFDKYFDRKSGLKYVYLPSTSPANTGIDFDNICKLWRQIFTK